MTYHLPKTVLSIFAIVGFGLLPATFSQQTKINQEQAEDARQRINQAIEQNVLKILESVELLEEEVEPMQTALVQYFAPVQMERLKMLAERQKAAAKGGGRQGRGGGNREAMMARMNKLEKLRTELDKKVKAILDKKQLKKYKNAMEKLMPQQRRGPGGGGGRGGL